MTGAPLIPPALEMWLVDRSRWETAHEHCLRARYLGYHGGPTGYGWRRKAQSIPATTGTFIHEPVAEILEYCRKHNRVPGEDIVYSAIRTSAQKYDKVVEKRGLAQILSPEDLAFRTCEQKLLMEGLIWAWSRVVLPRFLAEWEIIEVEAEGLTVIGCTCGLGDRIGSAEQHNARNCMGLVWMTRPDWISRRRAFPQTYRYDDVKTTSDAGMHWENQWQYRIQMLAGVLAAEQRYECTIDEVYVHGMIKGRREAEYNWQTKKRDGAKYQNSPLVYGWCRPGQPPVLPEDWQFSYDYVGGDGKNHRLGKEYSRTILAAMNSQAYAGTGCYSVSDFWTRAMGPERLAQTLKVVGPLYPRGDGQNWKLEQFLRQLAAAETRLQASLWRVHDLLATGLSWASPEVQACLDVEFPQTRGGHCYSYFGDVCEMLAICDRKPGWEDPTLLGMIPRRPHHAAELEQAIARGLLPPDEGLEDEGENDL